MVDQNAVADAACFLGQSLYDEGRFRQAAASYARCLELKPSDLAVQNSLALSLAGAGNFQAATEQFTRTLGTLENEYGLYNISVVIVLANLGRTRVDAENYKAVEADYLEASRIVEHELRHESEESATVLLGLGNAFFYEGGLKDAEQKFEKPFESPRLYLATDISTSVKFS